MPELPEVERARKLIETTCVGYKIAKVDTFEDKIVFTGGITHEDYAKELEGRTITGCTRKGKMFWMELSGDGPLPVMHFGMNGMLMLKGREPDWYMRKPKRIQESKDIWPPPKYVKFLLKLEPQESSVSSEPQELAYLDSRRLGKLRLVPQPVYDHPPISDLGFDPYLSLPTLEEFTTLLRSRPRSTIKGLIMDQSFSAGVGNWVADEILHLARVHPATPAGMLTDDQVQAMWTSMKEVVNTAVEVNADHSKFPKHWLFTWRWKKGKKDKFRKTKDETGGMRLPDGSPATLKFITVGGRTSAYIEELQKLPEGVVYKEPVKRGKASTRARKAPERRDLSCIDQVAKDGNDVGPSSEELSDAPVDESIVKTGSPKTSTGTKRVRRKPVKKVKAEKRVKDEGSSELSAVEEPDSVDEKPSKAMIDAGWTDVSGSKRSKRANGLQPDGTPESKPVFSGSKKRKTTAANSRTDDADDVKPGASRRKKRKVTTVKTADSSDLSSLSGLD